MEKWKRRQINAVKWQMQPGRWNWRWTSRYRNLRGEGNVLGSKAQPVEKTVEPETS